MLHNHSTRKINFWLWNIVMFVHIKYVVLQTHTSSVCLATFELLPKRFIATTRRRKTSYICWGRHHSHRHRRRRRRHIAVVVLRFYAFGAYTLSNFPYSVTYTTQNWLNGSKLAPKSLFFLYYFVAFRGKVLRWVWLPFRRLYSTVVVRVRFMSKQTKWDGLGTYHMCKHSTKCGIIWLGWRSICKIVFDMATIWYYIQNCITTA